MGQAKRRAAEIAELKKQGTMVTVRTLGIGDEDYGSDVYLIRGSQCAKMVNDYPEHARALIKGMPEGFLIQTSAEFINRMQQDARGNPKCGAQSPQGAQRHQVLSPLHFADVLTACLEPKG
jgi:hypothetical protein